MNNKKPIRVLQVVAWMNAGGMENYIMNLYRAIDRSKVQFDFLVHHAVIGLYEQEIEELGGKVYHFSVLDDKNVFKYIVDLRRFFAEHKEYKIVHGHLSSLAVFYLGVAKQYGVPFRIAHSHGAGFLHTPKGIAKYLLFRTTKWNANIRLACSTEAGKYLYGNSPFEFVPNGIDVERFSFDSDVRNRLREELGLENNYVIGHVGRFNLQKNHEYLLRIFKGVLDRHPEARLLLLGDGELFEEIQKMSHELHIEEAIIFAGVHKDVEKYYQAMDVFVLPSVFEGLPVTGIEAQYSGLPCVLSDKITKEVKITDLVHFVGISDKDVTTWIDVLSTAKVNAHRDVVRPITDIFDVRHAAQNMENRYKELMPEVIC